MLTSIFMTANFTVASVFAIIFGLIAVQEKSYIAPRWFALASICVAACVVINHCSAKSGKPHYLVLLAYSLSILNILATGIGLNNSYKRTIKMDFIGGFFLVTVAISLLIYEFTRTYVLCCTMYKVPIFITNLIVLWILIKSKLVKMVDRILCFLTVVSCINFLWSACIGYWPGVQTWIDDQCDELQVNLSLSIGVFVQVTCNLLLLLGTVSHMLGEVSEQSEIDQLSQLCNRRGFDRQVARILARKGERMTLSVIMSDMDCFKSINDTYGHDGGDQVIASVGRLLKRHAPKSAIVARMGGEEFVIFLPDTGLSEAQKLAEDIRKNVSELQFESPKGNWNVTSSFGVAQQLDGHSLYETMRRADTALYAAKHSGRDRVSIV